LLSATFSFLKIFYTNFANTLILQMDIYYKVVLHVIIENAQKKLLTVAKATFALLFPVLRQCQQALQLFITKPLADLR
jgi:hypothetical protein